MRPLQSPTAADHILFVETKTESQRPLSTR